MFGRPVPGWGRSPDTKEVGVERTRPSPPPTYRSLRQGDPGGARAETAAATTGRPRRPSVPRTRPSDDRGATSPCSSTPTASVVGGSLPRRQRAPGSGRGPARGAGQGSGPSPHDTVPAVGCANRGRHTWPLYVWSFFDATQSRCTGTLFFSLDWGRTGVWNIRGDPVLCGVLPSERPNTWSNTAPVFVIPVKIKHLKCRHVPCSGRLESGRATPP